MKREKDNDNSLGLDSFKEQDFLYDNSKDKTRLDLKAAAGAEENSDKI